MDAKHKSTIDKILQLKSRGNHTKALRRVDEAIAKSPDVFELYRTGVEVSVECGESMQAIRFLKLALVRFPAERAGLLALAREQASAFNDAAVGKFLLEYSIKSGDLRTACENIAEFPDRTIRDLLQRTRMKRTTLTSAASGGHTVSDELATNMFSEVILCIHLGRILDATPTIHNILDARPESAGILDPLLQEQAEKNVKSAQLRFALARCLAMLSRHKDATENMLAAVRIDMDIGPDALALLSEVGDQFDEVPDAIERALVEVLLITKQHQRAVEILRSHFEDTPAAANDIVEMLVPHAPREGEVTGLHLLLLDAAVEADRMGRVVNTIEELDREPGNRQQLLDWLGHTKKGRMLSADVMFVHATMLLDDGQYGEATRILRALCIKSHGDITRVVTLLSANRRHDESLEHLYVEISNRETTPSREEAESIAESDAPKPLPASDGGDTQFESYGNTEFRFSDEADDDKPGFEIDVPSVVPTITSPATADNGPGVGFNVLDGVNILGDGNESEGPTAPAIQSYSGSRRPLDDGKAAILWDEESDEEMSAPETPAKKDEPDERKHTTAEHVDGVAEALHASGASTFFHVEDEAAPEPQPEPQPEPPPEPVVEEITFHSRFDLFLDGRLDAGDVLDLMEEAVEDGRTEELRQLITVAAEDTEHDVRRLMCQAEYQMMKGRPAAALGCLQDARGADVSEEQRKRIWFTTVVCQRLMCDFDAAHNTLLQMVDLFPDCPEVNQMAKQNYKTYLESQCADATVLEKVTSLYGDS